MKRFFNWRTPGAPKWYLRILWLRLMWWNAPVMNNRHCTPIRGKWFSCHVCKGYDGPRFHFDIGPIEGFLARL